MTFDWYKIINQAEFLAEELVSKNVSLILESIGQVEVLVTKGNVVSITYDGVMLGIGVTDANPFVFDGYAVYLDDVNGDIWLGVPVEA